ncbi:MAG: hypothetical protein K5770_09775 [Lachnospiraceae bacterium]|nr:hypothetical protein [Lachnospiraceae bacterium]
MISAYNIFLIIIWGLIVPFTLGTFRSLMTGEYKRISLPEQFCFGFAFELFVFHILAVPFVYFRKSYTALKYSWLFLIIIMLAVSIVALIRHKKDFFPSTGPDGKKLYTEEPLTICVWAAVILMIIFETGLLTFNMHMDTDDARFVAEAVDALENDSLLGINPITGESTAWYFNEDTDGPIGEMKKDAASPYPLFIGLVSDLFGLNPAVCSHTVMPALFIPLCFAAFYLPGSYFLNGDKKNTGIFLLFFSVITLFSFESGFAFGYTLLNIIWQGRSIACCIMLPMLFYWFAKTEADGRLKYSDFFMLFILNCCCAMLSGTAAIVASIMTFACSVTKAYRVKSIPVFILTGLTAFPCLFCLVYGQYILG